MTTKFTKKCSKAKLRNKVTWAVMWLGGRGASKALNIPYSTIVKIINEKTD